jgi:hypothetical protein
MLQRREQERTELSPLGIGTRMDFVLDQMPKKTLRQVLGIVHGIAAIADIRVERRPVGLAKLGQRSVRDLRLCLSFARRDDHAPVSGREGISLAENGFRRILHAAILTTRREKAKPREKSAISCSTVF